MAELEKNTSKSVQESVKDYPLPPRLEKTSKHLNIIFNGVVIAESTASIRILEKGHPPVYYIPPADVKKEFLSDADNKTICEWKGEASYYHLTVGDKNVRYACWYYPNPVPAFISLKNYIAFYPQKMDACYLDGELVTPDPGKYYGGWITKDIIVS